MKSNKTIHRFISGQTSDEALTHKWSENAVVFFLRYFPLYILEAFPFTQSISNVSVYVCVCTCCYVWWLMFSELRREKKNRQTTGGKKNEQHFGWKMKSPNNMNLNPNEARVKLNKVSMNGFA